MYIFYNLVCKLSIIYTGGIISLKFKNWEINWERATLKGENS